MLLSVCCCEGRKEAEHAGEVRRISRLHDLRKKRKKEERKERKKREISKQSNDEVSNEQDFSFPTSRVDGFLFLTAEGARTLPSAQI